MKISIVGCGRISGRHASILKSGMIPELQLISVCDTNKQKAKTLGEKHSVPFFYDMIEMVERVDPDVICILTESGLHADHVRALAQYKKHLVIEKPLALTLNDLDDMDQLSKKYKFKIVEVKQNRFNLPVIKLRDAIEAGNFGRLILGSVRVRWCRDQSYYDLDKWRGTWKFDGGVLANQAIHHIDLLQWMMGDVVSVNAYASTSLVNIECEDVAVVNIKFKNGALGQIEATTATRPTDLEGSISILGEKGTVVIGGFAVNRLDTWRFSEKEEGPIDCVENPPNVYGYGHETFYKYLKSHLLQNEKILVDAVEARKSISLLRAIYQSIESGDTVYLGDDTPLCRLGSN
jgi:predicted dehydrogenase